MDSINKLSSAESSHQSKVVIANHNKIANLNTTNTHNNQIKTNQSDSNFEYEDNEWDIGIGDLIIDLDADIEKSSNVDSALMIPLQTLANSYSASDKLDSPEKTNIKGTDSPNMSTMSNSSGSKNAAKLSIDNHQATLDKGLKMKIKRTKMGNSKHEIVKSEAELEDQIAQPPQQQHNKNSSTIAANKRGNSSHKKEKQSKTHCKDKLENSIQEFSSCNCDSDKTLSPCSNCLKESSQGDKISLPGSGFIGVAATATKSTSMSVKDPKGLFDKDASSSISAKSSTDEDYRDAPPPSKRPKCDLKDMVDVCVGTSIGTITEPDCLGPCEPGTSVTLEGIVWHESEGGVLAVNVTWRGKTYVGTLIDCTKHDWAPPRFCDSPTEDLESRLQKGGRSKRGRNATNDLLNFTETRSSVHSKLRNGSKVPKQDKRRKSKDESPSSVNGNSFQANVVNNHAGNIAAAQKQLAAKQKSKNLISPCAISPVLIECPEQDCSKKYKHANGLKYHQSHAHGTNFSAEDEIVPPDSPATVSASEQSKISNEKPEDTDKKLQKLDESTNDAESVDKSIKDSSIVEDGSTNEKSIEFKALESDGVSNESSMDPNFFQLNSQGKNNNLNLNVVRCKKNRKSPTTLAPSENVRSPAYSDISDDDSNAPTDSSTIDKKASELQKGSVEPGAGSMLLGSYNHLSFYQSPAFLQSADHLKSLTQITSPDRKEQTPLDLISKMHLDKGASPLPPSSVETLPSSNEPSVPKGAPYQHFPYSLMQTSFPFNGENFPPFQSAIDGEKNSPTSLKQEKDLEQPKQTLSVKPLSRLEETKDIKIESDQQPPGGFLNYSKYATTRDDEFDRRSSINSSSSSLKGIKEESPMSIDSSSMQNQKISSCKSSSSMKSQKEIKEEKEFKLNKNEGQKPTMETQGPPPPPTNQYYLNLPYHLAGSASGPPFFADHAIYRNMLVPSSYNSPYHLQNLQMARFSTPEDLSRNTANTKALDLLQQHASQYYNTHKIHELNDRVNQLSKSPSNNIRMSASGIPSSVIHGSSPMPILPPGNNAENRANNPTQQSPGPPPPPDATNKVLQLNNSKIPQQPPERPDSKEVNRTSSPPPQRHHHTHHHTHVYPIYGTPYVNPAAVLGTPPAVAVINPFANPPPK